MDRVNKIPEVVSNVAELARFTEQALDELDTIVKQSKTGVTTSAQGNPSSGDLYYDDDTDTLFIYNATNGQYEAH